MKILDVLIQHAKVSLDRPFSYFYDGEADIKVGYRVTVKFNNQVLMAYVCRITQTDKTKEQINEERGFELGFIVSVIDDKPLINQELMDLVDEISSYYLAPKISVLQAMLPSSLKPSLSALNGPKIAYETYVRFITGNEDGLTDKQIEMLRFLAQNIEVKKSEIGSPTVLANLVKAGRCELIKKEKKRFEIKEYEKEQPHDLTFEQNRVYEEILHSEKGVVLLHGVTGSGKTEIYLHLSEQYLKQGKNILMLVPEIALTPIMVEYFSRRFKGDVAILHSELTPAQKYDEYRRIAEGKAKVVVGARSAVFAPLENIGLIILDEEHVESYKQDTLPYYHAREVAIMRAKHFGAKVVLGSATPSLETRARAKKGVYGYCQLFKRVNERDLPKTEIVNLTEKNCLDYKTQIFSKKLLNQIKDRLAKKEQVILLINRRGYSSYSCCTSCGHIFECPNCHSKLAYHKNDDMLKCHHCDFVMKYPTVCPSCGGTSIKRIGFGTERIVKTLQEAIPNCNVGRLDSDIGKVRNNIAKELRFFKEHVYDILVGTQMIAKGHDFPDVTLVGVVQADIGLSLPTYRASERTFGLIAQAVGRSGRASKEGEALIQTYNPTHYAITLAAKQDYETFFLKEMQERYISQYPPYVNLIALYFSAKSEERCIQAAEDFRKAIEEQAFEDVSLLGPISPFYSFLGGVYKRSLLVKFKKDASVKDFIGRMLHSVSGKGGVDIVADVDPLDF